MSSWLLSRRAFLSSVGGAMGLHAILRNLEARASGAEAPARLLIVHHPQGTVRREWLPESSTAPLPRILAPFEPLRERLTILDGLDAAQDGPGGRHEKGTVTLMTGAPTVLLRDLLELDDPCADGPSIDQLLLARSPLLGGTAVPSLQAGVDGRVEAGEIGSRCLSYSTGRRAVRGASAIGEEHIPLLPVLEPWRLYDVAFGALLPEAGPERDRAARALLAEHSVLDFLVEELQELRSLSPASERVALDAHESAIRELERRLVASSSSACQSQPEPQQGEDSSFADDGRLKSVLLEPLPDTPDASHGTTGMAHFDVIRAAFQCDLTRVATFQWAPSTSFVVFGGELTARHGAVAQSISPAELEASPDERSAEAEFLVSVDEWYSQRLAEFVSVLSSTPDLLDPSGGSLLDRTLVVYVSDVAYPGGPPSPLPVLLFGGRGLGVAEGQLQSYPGRAINDLWLSIAAVLGVGVDDLQGEKILRGRNEGPLPGLLV